MSVLVSALPVGAQDLTIARGTGIPPSGGADAGTDHAHAGVPKQCQDASGPRSLSAGWVAIRVRGRDLEDRTEADGSGVSAVGVGGEVGASQIPLRVCGSLIAPPI